MTDAPVQILTTGDVLEALPPAAAEHLRKLRQQVEDASVLRRAAADALADARATLLAAQARQKTLERPESGLKGSTAQIEAQAEVISRRQAEVDRLAAIERARSGERSGRSKVVSGIERFLQQSGGLGITDVPLSPIALRKGEDTTAALARVRASIADQQAKLAAVRKAPVPADIAVRRMREQIAALAKEAAPNVSALLRGENGTLEFPQVRLPSAMPAVAPGSLAPDAVGLLCWVMGETIMEKLERDILAQADDAHALDAEAKREQIASISTSIVELERAEEALIREMEASGRSIMRRADASPCAILAIDTHAKERAPRPGTSPGQVFAPGGPGAGRRADVRMG